MNSQRAELFTGQVHLEPEDSRSTRLIPFEVPAGFARLILDVRLSEADPREKHRMAPAVREAMDRYYLEGEQDAAYLGADEATKAQDVKRYCDGLSHYVAVALYDSDGIPVGRRDARSPLGNSVIEITSEASAPGYRSHKARPGRYTLALEITQVLSGGLDIEIRIAGQEGSKEAPAPENNAEPVAPEARDAEERSDDEHPGGFAWLNAVVLAPSIHGEGQHDLHELAAMAEQCGIDVLLVADVNSTVICEEALPDCACTILFGQVFDTFLGRSAGMDLLQPVMVNESSRQTETSWIAERVHDQGGLFAVLHPFALGEPINPGLRWVHEDIDLDSVDWLHVWMGSWADHSPEIINSLRLWDYLLGNGLNVQGFAVDLRGLADNPWPQRLPYLRLRSQSRHRDHIRHALSQGHFISTRGPEIDIAIVTGSIEARSGEEARLEEGTTYQIVIDASGYGSAAILRVIRDGAPMVEMPLSSSGEDRKAFHAMAKQERSYFRAEIHQFGPQGDELLALTNPVVQRTTPAWWARPRRSLP